jgi:hypothetical protein
MHMSEHHWHFTLASHNPRRRCTSYAFQHRCVAVVSDSMADAEAPEEFHCPITHQIMLDPVVDAHGDTYDREAIRNWYQDHNKSPMSGALRATALHSPCAAVMRAPLILQAGILATLRSAKLWDLPLECAAGATHRGIIIIANRGANNAACLCSAVSLKGMFIVPCFLRTAPAVHVAPPAAGFAHCASCGVGARRRILAAAAGVVLAEHERSILIPNRALRSQIQTWLDKHPEQVNKIACVYAHTGVIRAWHGWCPGSTRLQPAGLPLPLLQPGTAASHPPPQRLPRPFRARLCR